MRSFCLLAAWSLVAALHASPSFAASTADIAAFVQQELVANYAKDGPGAAIIVARGDEIVFRGARGLGDVANATPLTPDSEFKIGSITKQFAAAALMQLVDQGKLSLDDPLSKFVAGFPNGDKINVREVLNHTSGVKNYTDGPQQVSARLTTHQIIATFENDKPDFAPGTSWAYDNSGYVLAGAVIEAVSGRPWHAYLHDALLVPLGLSHTADSADRAGTHVRGYTLIDGKPLPAQGVFSVGADGALVSNVDDLLKWNRALHKGRVLRDASYRAMITPVGAALPEQYGFALWHTTLRDHAMIAHSGHITGFSAYLLYLPDSDVSVAMLQNIDRDASFADPGITARKIAAFAIDAPYATPAPVAVTVEKLQEAQGVYGADPPGPRAGSIQGARLLRVVDGKLTMSRSGDLRSELMPVGVDAFQSKSSFDLMHLERDARGAITSLRFFAQGEGNGIVLARSADVVESVQTAIDLPPGALERVVGTYVADGLELRIFIDGGRLKGEVAGQPPAELKAESANKFFVAEVDATLEFAPVGGVAQDATLHQGGEIVALKRKR